MKKRRFVGEFLAREGESVKEAKARLSAEMAAQQDAAKGSMEAGLERAKTETEKRVTELPTPAGSSREIARASVEAARTFESVPVPFVGKE